MIKIYQLWVIMEKKQLKIAKTYDVFQKNTPRIITLKKYVMRRICEIKLHKQLYPTITFADVFKKCRMTNAARDAKLDARNNIIKLFEHLQEKNFIKSFELEKRNGAFYSIKFTYEPKKANT